MTAILPLLARYWYVAVIAGLGVLLGLSQSRLTAEKMQHANTRAAHAVVLKDLAEKTAEVYKAVLADEARRKTELAALDQKYSKELSDAKFKNDELAGRISAGTVGLRVNAKCPAGSPGVPQTGSPTRVDDAAGPRLTETAQRDYLDLRRGIDTSRTQIAGLQEFIRTQCLAAQ